MTGPATTYSAVTKSVDAIVRAHAENDPTVVLYMVARAAILQVRGFKGDEAAAEMCFRIGDEIAALKVPG